MKKIWIKRVIVIFIVLIGTIYIVNIPVTIRQCVNYKCRNIEMPLYLKLLDFFDRHYNYKITVKRIINDSMSVAGEKKLTEKEKVLRIFKWTHENIKKTPEGYPIIDDHVWHIIIRSYGEHDQFSDVFTTLCNYIGVDAFFSLLYKENITVSLSPSLQRSNKGKIFNNSYISLSFVKINERWNVFDPYNGVYFKNTAGELASIEDIMNRNWLEENIDITKKSDVDYNIYLKNLLPIKEMGLERANIQSPLNRLRYEIKKWVD